MPAQSIGSLPVITRHPADRTVLDGRAAGFSATVEGDPRPLLQWFKEGLPIANATNSSLFFPAVYPGDAGRYWISASNLLGTATSSNALLTVLADTNAPALLSAIGHRNLTNITLGFSEAIVASTATNTGSFEIFQTRFPTNRLAVFNTALPGSTSVVLTTAARMPGIHYSLRVNGIRDSSSSSNEISADTVVDLKYNVDLVPIDAGWKYYQDGQQPHTNWWSSDYDDSLWATGAALFHAGTPLPAVMPVRTPLSLMASTGAVQTYYFRTTFGLPGVLETNSIRLHHIVDDGTVFYLNGSEVLSIGMPTARPISYGTSATRSVGVPDYEPSLASPGRFIPATNVTTARNWFAAEIHQSPSGLSDAAFAANLDAIVSRYHPHPTLVLPEYLMEGAGTLATLYILEPLDTNLVIQLRSTRSDLVTMQPEVTIPAGATNAPFNLDIGDDATLTGPRFATLIAESSGLPPSEATLQLLDNETNTIELILPPATKETNGSFAAFLRFSLPAIEAVTVSLASSDINELRVPLTVTMPAGATSLVFQATPVDERLLDGARAVTVSAAVAGWPVANAHIVVNDNEPGTLTLKLPFSVLEGSGNLPAAGRVELGGIATSNIIAVLESSAPGVFSVPSSVMIPAGQSNATFEVDLLDDADFNAEERRVTITATSLFGAASNTIVVFDNDVYRLRFSAIGAIQTTDTPFGVLLQAEDPNGRLMTNFTGSLTLGAFALEGALPLEPSETGAFNNGQRYLTIRVTVPGHAVRIRGNSLFGESEAFNVGGTQFAALTQAVADVAWHESSQLLLAAIPNSGGVHSNRLAVMDPANGAILESYPLGGSPGQIEMAPGGDWLYVALNDGAALQRFDIGPRHAGPVYPLGTNTNPVRFAYDFCVPAGATDSVVVEARDRTPYSISRAGMYRYDSGRAVALPTFDSSGGWYLESLPAQSEVLLSPPLVRANALSGAILSTPAGFLGQSALYRDGRLYDDQGNAYSANNVAFQGTYPGVLRQFYYPVIAEVNPILRRVFYLSGYANYGTTFFKLKVFDRDLFQPLFELPVPGTPAVPTRLVRRGTNGLAYVTGNNQLWFVPPDLCESPRQPVNLRLSMETPGPTAFIGSNYTFTLIVSNSGPGLASLVRVTNVLPANVTVMDTAASSGSFVLTGGTFTWNVAALPAGSKATLAVTLQFGNMGWQTNWAWALGFEADPVFSENRFLLPIYVEISPTAMGAFPILMSCEDLVYDPACDRLVLSVANGTGGQINGIAILNPHRGVVESFTPLGTRPGRLARSDDGQFLYVSLPDEARVRRLNLTNLSTSLEFSLGGEDIYGTWYPFYAEDMAVMPGTSGTLVAWRVRRPGPMAGAFPQGIAIFDNGVMRSNVTAAGGTWKVEFDTTTRALYAYYGGETPHGAAVRDLYQCEVTQAGISLGEKLGLLTFTVGTDLEYAAGKFFFTAGMALRPQPFGVLGIYSGSETAPLVEPDALSDRVFYLANSSGTYWLNAYQMDRFGPLGSLVVSNVSGAPRNLIRWGTNGLAFHTTGGQVYIIRTPLIQRDATADLAIEIAAPDTPVAVGQETLLVLSVTNHGPISATEITVTNYFSPAVDISSATCTRGTCQATNNKVVWTLPILEIDQAPVAEVLIKPRQPGVVNIAASVLSATPDTLMSDNSAMRVLKVGGEPGGNRMAVLSLDAKDLVWSPAQNRILAAAGSNALTWEGSLVSIDPESLSIKAEAYLGKGADKLAIARDGSMLYAGLDWAIQALELPGMSRGPRFNLDPEGGLFRPAALDVAPGLRHMVAATAATSYDFWIAVYTNGIRRTNTSRVFGQSITFGESTEHLFSVWGSVFYNGYMEVSEHEVNSSGVSLLRAPPGFGPWGAGAEVKFSQGRLYTSPGYVLDAATLSVLGAFPNIPAGSLMEPDLAIARVFFLSPEGTGWTLAAYDAQTFRQIGALRLPGITGTPGSLVRWGANGLAFQTSSNQLVILQTSLVPVNAPAELVLTLDRSPGAYTVGYTNTHTIVISNAGPNAVPYVNWTNALPAGALITRVDASAGTVQANGVTLSGALEAVAPGSSVVITVSFVLSTPGVFSIVAGLESSNVDPTYANNVARALVWVHPSPNLPNYGLLALATRDLVRHPRQPILYASLGTNAGAAANSVVAIYPETGVLGTPCYIGGDPGRLAISSQGDWLYVALNAEGVVQRLNLNTMTPDLRFAVPNAVAVADMAVAPFDANSLVIGQIYDGALSLFRQGAKTPAELRGLDLFAFSDTTGELYACDGYHSGVPLHHVGLSSNGLVLLDSHPAKQYGEMKFANGRLHFGQGMIFEPESRRVLAMLSLPSDTIVEPDPSTDRIFALSQLSGTTWNLRAFDYRQFLETGSAAVNGVLGLPKRLTRWGSDGIAFRTATQLYLARTALIPQPYSADIALNASVSQSRVSPGAIVQYRLTITNLSTSTASQLIVTQGFSLQVTGVTVMATAGSVTTNSRGVYWQLEELGPAASASLEILLRPAEEGTLVARAVAQHNGDDPQLRNNIFLLATSVGPLAATNQVLNLATRELIYDSVRDRIYASIAASEGFAGNSVMAIDPAYGTQLDIMPTGPEPNQLALSDDGRYLYVSEDGSMSARRIDLSRATADVVFPWSVSNIFNVFDLEVMPGRPETIAVSRVAINSGRTGEYPTDLVLYDGPIQRPAAGGLTRSLEFSDDGKNIYGYVTSGMGYGLLRLWVDESGISRIEIDRNSSDADLEFSNGRIYTYYGNVIDPSIPLTLGTIPVAGPVAPDQSSGRVFYLTQQGTNWQLRAFKMSDLQEAGTQIAARAQGTPGSLIRAGGDRLAFRTSANQLFILRSPLVPIESVRAADLSVSQVVTQDLNAIVESLVFTVTVTNRGSSAAEHVMAAIEPPSAVASLTLDQSHGTSRRVGDNFLWQIGLLQTGEVAQLILSAVVTNSAAHSNFVSVTADVEDPNLLNNASLAVATSTSFLPADSARSIPIAVRDLAYDRVSRRLFGSVVESNRHRIVWFNIETVAVEGAIPLSAPPDKLAMTDDGQYLYVSGLDTPLVQRIHVPSGTIDLSFNLPTVYAPQCMSTLPTQSRALALSYYASNAAVTSIFDDGAPRPNQVQGRVFRLLAPNSDGTTVFGYDDGGHGGASPDVFRMAVNPAGLILQDTGPSDTPWGRNQDMNFSGDRLYFGNGDVLVPNGWLQEPSFPQTWDQYVEINASANRAIFVAPGAQLNVYNLLSRTLLARLNIPANGLASLTQCDADRVAFRTIDSVVFARSSGIPAADLILRVVSSNQVTIGENITVQLIASNAGSQAVTGVVLTNTLPPSLNIVSMEASQGSVTTNGQNLIAVFGSLAANASATLRLVVSPSILASGSLTNTTELGPADIPDPLLYNNRRQLILTILRRDTDRDGLPDDWELAHQLNPADPLDATLDSDCDGKSNAQEFAAGTDPRYSENVRIASPRFNSQGYFELAIQAAPGQSYVLESSADLSRWLPVKTFVCQKPDEKLLAPSTPSSAFFRLRAADQTAQPVLTLITTQTPAENVLVQIIAPPGRSYSVQSSTNLLHWTEVSNYYATACLHLVPDPTWRSHRSCFYRVLSQ